MDNSDIKETLEDLKQLEQQLHQVEMSDVDMTLEMHNLYKLIDEASQSHEPIQITGKQNNAVLLSETDWISIQETLYLLSIPNMRESIRDGLNEPLEQCSEKPGW